VAPPAPTTWGTDPEVPVQPQLYAYHDSTACEQPGSASLRALSGGPTLSDNFVPVFDTWSPSLAADAPALAAAEAAADAAACAAEEQAQAPGAEDDAAEAQQGKAEQIAAQVEALLPPPAAEEAPEPGCEDDGAPGEAQAQPPRTRYQQLLDRSKAHLHEEAVAQQGAKAAAHNKQLSKPGQHGLP
jgi:hypothetical protein